MFMEATAYPRLNLNLDCFAGMASVIGDVSASQAAALSPCLPVFCALLWKGRHQIKRRLLWDLFGNTW
jgi:hypothetical protein